MRGQFQRVFQADDEGAQVAIIDANEIRSGVEDARQVLRIVQLDQRLHLRLANAVEQSAQLIAGQNLGDQQDGVGTGGARLQYLIRVEEEVFTKRGDRYYRTNLLQISQ